MHILRKPSVLLLAMAVMLTSGAAHAQQDGDVKVIITAKSKPGSLPTLLVMCDMMCTWKLDGEIKGQIDAGGSAKVKVEPGQHMVEATTDDGVDQVKLPSTVKPTGQTMVSIELQPIRYARLISEQEEIDEVAKEQAAQERAKRDLAERQNREMQERERIAHDDAVGVWTDSKTGLMWTKKDNGSDVTWQQAVDYCRNLRLSGYSDWSLPTIDVLYKGIYSADMNIRGDWRVKGSLQLTGSEWSETDGDSWSSKTNWNDAKSAKIKHDIYLGGDYVDTQGQWSKKNGFRMRALCVRHSEN